MATVHVSKQLDVACTTKALCEASVHFGEAETYTSFIQ